MIPPLPVLTSPLKPPPSPAAPASGAAAGSAGHFPEAEAEADRVLKARFAQMSLNERIETLKVQCEAAIGISVLYLLKEHFKAAYRLTDQKIEEWSASLNPNAAKSKATGRTGGGNKWAKKEELQFDLSVIPFFESKDAPTVCDTLASSSFLCCWLSVELIPTESIVCVVCLLLDFAG